MQRTYRVIVTGLGNIGANFLAIIAERAELLRDHYGVALQIVGVADSSGAIANADGFDPAAICALKGRGERVATLVTAAQPLLTAGEMIAQIDADFLLEATPTNLRDGQPGLDLVRTALDRGMHAVLASKGPLVLAYQELTALATRSTLAFSGAVCGAMPTVNVGRRDLAGGTIERAEAIFNGTTQVILGLMAAGQSYEAALAEAQRIGIAEPDPTLDVEGWDAANKLVIFANAVLRQPTTLADVAITGITGITKATLQAARAANERISLLAVAARQPDGHYDLTVRPITLTQTHPLTRLDLDEMGIVYYTDIYGRLTVTSANQGPTGAAAAMLRDVLEIVRTSHQASPKGICSKRYRTRYLAYDDCNSSRAGRATRWRVVYLTNRLYKSKIRSFNGCSMPTPRSAGRYYAT
jgi:homoserine dehydrogenase